MMVTSYHLPLSLPRSHTQTVSASLWPGTSSPTSSHREDVCASNRVARSTGMLKPQEQPSTDEAGEVGINTSFLALHGTVLRWVSRCLSEFPLSVTGPIREPTLPRFLHTPSCSPSPHGGFFLGSLPKQGTHTSFPPQGLSWGLRACSAWREGKGRDRPT
jgi:hypothetical protein